jgi:hypothetical protein
MPARLGTEMALRGGRDLLQVWRQLKGKLPQQLILSR